VDPVDSGSATLINVPDEFGVGGLEILSGARDNLSGGTMAASRQSRHPTSYLPQHPYLLHKKTDQKMERNQISENSNETNPMLYYLTLINLVRQ
jgi:hypothetical protein